MRAVFDRDQHALRALYRTTPRPQFESPDKRAPSWLSRLWRRLFT
jgi:hypothetical protein